MIPVIHEALRSMLYGQGQIPAPDVDVTFAVPTRDWMAGINRPTINFYLYALTENTQFRESEFTNQYHNLQMTRRLRPRRMDLRYLVTTHFKSPTAEVHDEEWQVLWRVLATLMRNAEWADEILPREIRTLEMGLQSHVAQADGSPRTAELFSSLGIPPRAALHYALTVPLDLNVEIQSPLAIGVNVAFQDSQGSTLLEVQRYAWKLLNEQGQPIPGVEVRLPDQPGFSLSGLDGTFTIRVPHAEVKQFLVRRPEQTEWEVLKVKKGSPELLLPTHQPRSLPKPN